MQINCWKLTLVLLLQILKMVRLLKGDLQRRHW